MERTVSFIKRNARPLDFLLWQHSRGRDRREEVLDALAAYQNDDGGFAWAIEPDNFTECSTPMGTWKATMALRQIDCFDRDVPLVHGAIDYFLQSRRPDGYWDATAPETNGFPHAEWWEDTGPDDRVWGINPTAAVLGYLLRAGIDVQPDVRLLVDRYVCGGPVTMTELPCALTLHHDMRAMGTAVPVEFTERLGRDIAGLMEYDQTKWSDYVVRPSTLFSGQNDDFASPYADLIVEEQHYLLDTMNPDGSWEPNWRWRDFPEEWAVARNWWKAIQAREYLDFLNR